MGKTVLLFSGQGSQYVGMGNLSLFAPYWQQADSILGYPLSSLVQEGPSEELALTLHTQPALYTYQCAQFDLAKPYISQYHLTLGHSIGEYAALYAAGCFDFATGLKLVQQRAQAMHRVSDPQQGMSAVLGVEYPTLMNLCEKYPEVSAANINTEKQVVLSGKISQITELLEELKKDYRPRIIPLKVSAAFHSPFMAQAQESMKKTLAAAEVTPNKTPYIANKTAQIIPVQTPGEEIKKLLTEQISGQVLWYQSLQKLTPEDKFIELGAGKPLAGMVKKTFPLATCLSLDPIVKNARDESQYRLNLEEELATYLS